MKNRSSISLFTTVLLGLAAISAPAWGAAYDAGGTAGRVSLYMTKTSSGDQAVTSDANNNLKVNVATGSTAVVGSATGSVGNTAVMPIGVRDAAGNFAYPQAVGTGSA